MGKTISSKNLKSEKRNNKQSFSESTMSLPTWRKVYLKPSNIILDIIVILLAIFFLRVGIWEHFYLERMEGSERHVPESIIYNDEGEVVDETEPTAAEVEEYIVAADKPRYITIPSVAGVSKTRIVEIGTKSNGALSTPASIYDVGWYRGSDLPGSQGTAVLDGHGGARNVGVFGNLPQIKAGDRIEIEMGDGRVFVYRVIDTATKPLGATAEAYMVDAFTTPEPGQGSLTLITCTGTWLPASRTYSDRFFVRAVLEETADET